MKIKNFAIVLALLRKILIPIAKLLKILQQEVRSEKFANLQFNHKSVLKLFKQKHAIHLIRSKKHKLTNHLLV